MSGPPAGNPLRQVEEWPVAVPAVAVVGPDGTLATHGPRDTEYDWASVTKLLTALAVLDTVVAGRLHLDEPAGPPGSTVRHLLAHASGLSPEGDAVLGPPGRRRVYSDRRGFEILAELVAARTGTDFAGTLSARVCRPLGMDATRLAGSAGAGARGPARDLARLGRELLRPTLLPAEVMAEAIRTAFPGLSGVLPGFGRQDPNDWGLGFEIRDAKSPHWTGTRNSPATFGHFGRSGSFLWIDPEADLGCVCLTDTAFGPWAATAWPALSDAVLETFAAR